MLGLYSQTSNLDKDWTDKMTQEVKELAIKPGDLNRIPRIHKIEGENQLL